MSDNTIHRLDFARKIRVVYGQKITFDMTNITFDTDQKTFDKTHDIIKL